MNNLNKITKILGVTFVLSASASTFAQTVNSTVTVGVQNAFTVTETTPLDFGTVRATADATNAANFALLVLSPNGTYTPGAAVGASAISSLVPGTAGEFAISGAASFTNLTVTYPVDDADVLTTAGAPPLSPNFTIVSWNGIVVGGSNDGAVATNNVQTDNTGAVGIKIGATLKTDKTTTNTGAYIDAPYSAAYTFDISY
ncbi:MAG: hypothetical protein GY787_01515 [Alteromonadales bacterium]|nr:hypothetical protein [Alteromonadales bacterium]MCP4984713.1 hypothetical protein [Colwellia sp.]